MRTADLASRPARRAGRSLLAGAAALAAVALVVRAAPGLPADAAHAHACAAGACALAPPTADELAALVGEADRLLAHYAGDATAHGRQCHALGALMRAGTGAVRMLPFMWRAADPDGNVGLVSGDAHTVEPAAGAGVVHIARGVDALNPDRGLPAIVGTARHEFAHLALHRDGVRQGVGWGLLDPAGALAASCGPADR